MADFVIYTPVISSASVSPATAYINTSVTITVAVEDVMRVLEPEIIYSNEIYSNEVI